MSMKLVIDVITLSTRRSRSFPKAFAYVVARIAWCADSSDFSAMPRRGAGSPTHEICNIASEFEARNLGSGNRCGRHISARLLNLWMDALGHRGTNGPTASANRGS